MIKTAIALALIILSFPLQAAQEMDLFKFIDLARKNDIEIEKILHQRVRTSFLKDLSMPSSAIVLGVSNQYGFAVGNGERTEFWVIGAEKTFRKTGTSISVTYDINKQEDREEKETTVTVQQPLFRNALGKQNRRLEAKLSKENEAIMLQVVETYEDYIATLISNYLDWQLTHLNRQITNMLLKESRTLQKYIEQRAKRNIAHPVDVGKVRLQTMGYEETVLELEVGLSSQLAAIAESTGMEDIKDYEPSEKLDIIKEQPNLQDAMRNAVEQSRMVRAYRLADEAGAMEISIRKEDLHPDLNLVFGFGYDDSTRFTVSTNRKEVFVGFNLEIPLWDTRKKATVKEARYEKMAASLALAQYKKNLASSLKAQMDRISKQKKRVELSRKKLELSEDVMDKESKRYKSGKIDIETLIDARQSSARNRFTFLSNRIQYDKDLVEWLRLTDKLIVKDEINLPN